MLTTSEIRKSFHDFFASKDHKIVPSAPLLPTSPNLLFTNAGMNQFVPFFLGDRKSPNKRIADTQKCIRAGGKHNDLEDVGLDTYHHTLFEMLGNWSFGDYFKKEAIEWSWELLTQVWKFPKERLYATIYKPQEGDPAEEDKESRELWTNIFKKEGLDPNVHVITGGKKDNFWMMGETGPCGPCSELHIDLTQEGNTKGQLVNADSNYCIEIWNLVFIQFNAQPDGSYEPLVQNHVDTGMGLERVAGILATTEGFTRFDKPPSNYDSDTFQAIFNQITNLGCAPYGKTLPNDPKRLSPQEFHDCAFRVLADHIRALTFSIADGILPGNEGRNYVLRRILRRALMYIRKLKLPDGSFSKLAPTVIETMGEAFPELVEQAEIIRKVLESEEKSFEKTLQRGLQLLDGLAEEGQKEISGKDAFLLYDTYGFPLDLTQLVAREKGLPVDTQSFQKEMDKQRERGRLSQKKEVITVAHTNSENNPTNFTGFNSDNLKGFTTTVIDVQTDERGSFLILDESPFYAEMGGQVGDTGSISVDGTTFTITDTIRDNCGQHLHKCDASTNLDLTNKKATCDVDTTRRKSIECHHTGTHLLNWALREKLGTHIKQAGSLVEENRLRFDFTHFEPVQTETLLQIEELINRRILENSFIETFETSFDAKPKDVIAFFGEKYGDQVRVVDVGGFSKELCGGCHVKSTAELGLFKIISEAGISAGTRRIEAVTAHPAHAFAQESFQTIANLACLLSCPAGEMESRMEALIKDRSAMEKQLQALRLKEIDKTADSFSEQLQDYEGLKILVTSVDDRSPKEIQSLAVGAFKKTKVDILVMGGTKNGKIFLNVLCSEAAIDSGHKAGEIVRSILQKAGGNGGGKPDFATGGGKDNGQLETILDELRSEPAALKNC